MAIFGEIGSMLVFLQETLYQKDQISESLLHYCLAWMGIFLGITDSAVE
jgi:hypothetical protein